MSDLFGSDLSDVESQASRLSSPRGSPRRPSRSRDSATPEPRKGRYDSESDEGGEPVRPGIQPANGDALDDLFGSDEDAEMRDSDNEATRGGDGVMSDDEAPEGLSRVNVRVMSARVPLLPAPRSDRDTFILTRMPNILQLDPTPFSADSYEDLIKKEHEVAAKHSVKEAVPPELASAVEGIIGNTIRWRRTAGSDGKMRRESNARLVRWSDGSTSIVIGGHTPETYSVASEPLDDSAKTKQHHYAAALYQNELLMQSHARLTEQWSLRPAKQSAQSRAAVSLLLGRVRARAQGVAALGGHAARATTAKTSRTRFEVDDENPELARKRAIEEDERREKQRKKEERLRERMEARGLQSERRNTGYASPTYAGDYSEEEGGFGYDSEHDARAGGPGYGPPRSVKRDVPLQSRRPRSIYADEELEDFIDDDEPEVGPRDEFDDEEEEELVAQRLKSSKRTKYTDDDDDNDDESDRGRNSRRAATTKTRRLMVSDDEDDDIDI
ncbi:Paf1 complex component [Coemansia sp. BCRC 34962]|nr:Paf1 complex component [Coemansia sp. BCRC 34962]